MNSRNRAQPNIGDPAWRRLAARFVRGLTELLEASEPKRKRPRNLYIQGMTSQRLVTRPYSE